MAAVVGATAGDLAAAGRQDAARHVADLDGDRELRRKVAAVPGLGMIGNQDLTSPKGQELLPLIAAGLDDIAASSLPAKARQDLTSMFVDNLVHDAARRLNELRLLLRIATEAADRS